MCQPLYNKNKTFDFRIRKILTFFVFKRDLRNDHVYTKTTFSLRQTGSLIPTLQKITGISGKVEKTLLSPFITLCLFHTIHPVGQS